MTFSIFISYSTADLEILDHIRGMLNNPHIKIFSAEYSVFPGEPLIKKIYGAIQNCDLFLLLWSSNSQNSEWVAREIELARSENKLIVPIKLDAESEISSVLSDIKYIPYHESPEKVLDWIQAHVFSTAKAKSWDPVIWLVLGAALLWLLTRK